MDAIIDNLKGQIKNAIFDVLDKFSNANKRKLAPYVYGKRFAGMVIVHVLINKSNGVFMTLLEMNNDSRDIYYILNLEYFTYCKLSYHCKQRIKERTNSDYSIINTLKLFENVKLLLNGSTLTIESTNLLVVPNGVFLIKDFTIVTYINKELLKENQLNIHSEFLAKVDYKLNNKQQLGCTKDELNKYYKLF